MQVENPKTVYKGQKPIKLVRRNTIAKTPKTSAAVPSIAFVKYKTPITIAKIMREILSAEPMFFHDIELFKGLKLYYFFGDFTNILNINPPITAPYKELFKGFEVMEQVPEAQPM